MFKKLFGLIFFALLVYVISSLDPETNESSIDISQIEETVSELKEISLDDVYTYINENWFNVKTTDNGFDVTVKDSYDSSITDDSIVTISSVPQKTELEKIAAKISWNETKGDRNNLVHWNSGEYFASMGIGHFLWYPKNRSKKFSEQFPDMIRYLHGMGVDVPTRLLKQIQRNKGAYWKTRDEWLNDKGSERFEELILFLERTKPQQGQFIQQRFILSLLKLYSSSKQREMKYMNSVIKKITNTPGGWYVLIDYTNFKGIGGKGNDGYNNYDWGLKAVLMNMKKYKDRDVLLRFSKASSYTLKMRVKNAPKGKQQTQEKKWLIGWKSRTYDYRTPY